MTPDKLLDEYYKPKMHWQSVNRLNVIAAMIEFSATNTEGQLQRLYEWMKDNKRKSADTAFTSGTMRNIARVFELLNSDIQSTGASPMQPNSSTSPDNQKSFPDKEWYQRRFQVYMNAADKFENRIIELEKSLKEKEDEIKLLEEREVLWSNKHELLNDEIRELKAESKNYADNATHLGSELLKSDGVIKILNSRINNLQKNILNSQTDLSKYKALAELASEVIKVMDIPKNYSDKYLGNSQFDMYRERNHEYQTLKQQL